MTRDARDARSDRVFVSYSSHDFGAAAELVRALRGDGLDAWMDADGVVAADGLTRSILRAVERAMAIVLLLSRRAVYRPWIRAEIDAARSLGIRIYALRIEDGPIPDWLGGVPVVALDADPEGALVDLADRLQRLRQRRRAQRRREGEW